MFHSWSICYHDGAPTSHILVDTISSLAESVMAHAVSAALTAVSRFHASLLQEPLDPYDRTHHGALLLISSLIAALFGFGALLFQSLDHIYTIRFVLRSWVDFNGRMGCSVINQRGVELAIASLPCVDRVVTTCCGTFVTTKTFSAQLPVAIQGLPFLFFQILVWRQLRRLERSLLRLVKVSL